MGYAPYDPAWLRGSDANRERDDFTRAGTISSRKLVFMRSRLRRRWSQGSASHSRSLSKSADVRLVDLPYPVEPKHVRI
jgi:hypothetical protein